MTEPDLRNHSEPLSGSLTSLSRLAEAAATQADITQIWTVAGEVFDELLGHRLYTVLAYDEASGLVTRLFTNRPDEYPVSGTKPMGPTPWGQRLLKQGLPYIGRDANDIRWAFPDHELIASMGLESVCNLPIRASGRVLGTINLLHQAQHYDDDCLPAGLIAAGLLAPTMTAALNELRNA